MKLNANLPALRSLRSMEISSAKADTAMHRLSSGLKLNSASDNAAGLAIANKLRTEIRALNMASRNGLDGISLSQTAEGALAEVHDMLQRMRELSVQSANGVLESADRSKILLEVSQLMDEINGTALRTEFNKINLLNVSAAIINVQLGSDKGMDLRMELPRINISSLSLNELASTILVGNPAAISMCDTAISFVSNARAVLGAYQNRLEHSVNNIDATSANSSQSLSRIADADMATEMTEYTKENVITQAAIAMIAQANTRPQQLLQLMR